MSAFKSAEAFDSSVKPSPFYLNKGFLIVIALVIGMAVGALMLGPSGATIMAILILLIYFVISFRSPLNGLLIWIVAQPLADRFINISLGAGIPDLSPTRICITFLCILVLARASIGQLQLVRWTKIDFIIIIFLIGMTLSAPRATVGWRSFQAIFDRYFVPVLVYFLAKNLVRTREQLQQVVGALIILGTYVGLYAIYEQLTGHILIPVNNSSNVIYGASGLRILRGLLGHPHEFGRVLGLIIPLTFYVLLDQKRFTRHALYFISLGIMLVGAYLTYRRTVWIAIVASLLLIQWFYPRFRKFVFILLFVVAGALYLNQDRLDVTAVTTRIESGDVSTLHGRTEGWAYALELWQQQPLLGYGYDRYADLAAQNGASDVSLESEYLRVLISAGLMGFVPFILLLILLPMGFIQVFRRTSDPRDKWLVVVFWGAYLSYLVNAYTATVGSILSASLLFLMAGSLTFLQSELNQTPIVPG